MALHDIALPRVSSDEVLLALLETAASKGMVGIDAQHGTPRGRSLLVVAKGVVNGREVKPSFEMVASAADGRFEIGGRFLKALPTEVEESALVPGMRVV